MDIVYFEKAGSLLFGDYWIIPMARALGVDRRTIYKWKDRGVVSPQAAETLKQLMTERRSDLKDHLKGLKAACKAGAKPPGN